MTEEENNLLCRVEGDAPMGQIMRRSWLPACLIEEVAEPDGKPLRVRLLGEDFVVFRDSAGKIGFLSDACPHRRASLSLGRNEECGLRCLYHGWKFDVNGNATDLASEPHDERMKENIKVAAYPVVESGGFIWTYLGPREEMPEFAPPVWCPTPDTKVSVVKIKVPCNWAQVLEGAIDSAHSSSLHASDMKFAQVDAAKATHEAWLRPSYDRAPRLQVQMRDWGFRYAAIRTPVFDADKADYVRITLFVAPCFAVIPPNNQYKLAQALVPIDDTHTMFHFIAWDNTGKGIETEEWRKFSSAQRGIDLNDDWSPVRTRENDYQQDRNLMKLGHFSGIQGIPAQDFAMWETQGAIAERHKERLGTSDMAIVQFRRQMLEAARHFQQTGEAIGAKKSVPFVDLHSWEGMVAKGNDWRQCGVSEGELAQGRQAAE